METVADGHNIVLVGGWNRKVFRPQWVTQELLGTNAVEYAIAVDDPSLPMKISSRHMRLDVSSERLQIGSVDPSDENFAEIQGIADRVLELLPHTPVKAAGVNCRWIERHPRENLLGVFQLRDNDLLADAGAIVGTTGISRALRLRDWQVNLSMRLERERNEQVVIDFNFHRATESSAVAREHLAQGVVELRNAAIELLANAYEMEVEANL